MQVRYFEHEDLDLLNHWLEKHRHPLVTLDELPKLGWVAEYKEEDGQTVIAAIAFLRLAEGNFAIADSLALNPDLKSLKTKARAFDAVSTKLIETARSLKIKHLLAYTVIEGLAKRSVKKHGFAKVDHKLLVKTL